MTFAVIDGAGTCCRSKRAAHSNYLNSSTVTHIISRLTAISNLWRRNLISCIHSSLVNRHTLSSLPRLGPSALTASHNILFNPISNINSFALQHLRNSGIHDILIDIQVSLFGMEGKVMLI